MHLELRAEIIGKQSRKANSMFCFENTDLTKCAASEQEESCTIHCTQREDKDEWEVLE